MLSRRSSVALAIASFICIAQSALAAQIPRAPAGHYDEVYAPNGEPRPAYADFVEKLADVPDKEVARFSRQARQAFRKDNPMSRIPRAFTAEEFDGVLRRGSEQRARALMAFAKDHYSGAKRYLAAGIVSANAIERILRRNVEAQYEGSIDPNNIHFVYGPDLIRAPDGRFLALEDNIGGDVGGVGDLLAAPQIWHRFAPEMRGAYERGRDPAEFFRGLADRYRARANGGRVVVLIPPPHEDQEDIRLARTWASVGVELVTGNTRVKLIVRDDGVFVRTPALFGGPPSEERVGFVALQASPADVDQTDPLVRANALTLHARRIESLVREGKVVTASRAVGHAFLRAMNAADPRTGVPDLAEIERLLRKMDRWDEFAANDQGAYRGLFEAWRRGQVELNNSPGLEFLNDKELCLRVDDLIRFYIGEEPIAPSVPGRMYGRYDARAGAEVLDREFADEVLSHQADYVIKPTNERGGKGVTLGARAGADEWAQADANARANFGDVEAQKLVRLSVVGDKLVDVRTFVDVPANGEPFSANVGWSRGSPLSGSGRVNLAQGGELLPVWVSKEGAEAAIRSSEVAPPSTGLQCPGAFAR